jgi:hypothetical protein
MRLSRPVQRGIWLGCLIAVVALLVVPASGAPLVTFTAPYLAAVDTYTHAGSNVGGGANTVHAGPAFTLSSGIGLESIESYSTTNAGTAAHDLVAHTGLSGLSYTCSGTCAGSYTATFKWDVNGLLSVKTTCPGGLGVSGTIFTQVTLSIRASVYDSTTSTLIAGGISTLAFIARNVCPASSSSPYAGTVSYGLAVSLSLGDTYLLNSTVGLETDTSMFLGTGATSWATSDAVANFGSPVSNNAKLVQVQIA